MGIRSLVLCSFVAASFSFSASARADIPNPTTSSSSSSSGSAGTGGTSGTGGSGSDNPNCTVSFAESNAPGVTCQVCTTSSCSSLDSSYAFSCQATASSQVWCNGPVQTAPSDQNVACSVAIPGGSWSSFAACAAVAATVALLRRRR
jgi:hypothetical protein